MCRNYTAVIRLYHSCPFRHRHPCLILLNPLYLWKDEGRKFVFLASRCNFFVSWRLAGGRKRNCSEEEAFEFTVVIIFTKTSFNGCLTHWSICISVVAIETCSWIKSKRMLQMYFEAKVVLRPSFTNALRTRQNPA